MGRDKEFPLTEQMRQDAKITVDRVNNLLSHFGQFRKVTSGYRPSAINSQIKKAAEHSNHTVCRACDLYDPEGDLDRWCVNNQKYLEEIGLWLENPSDTPGWTHCQIVAPKSGHRIFFA